MERISLFDVALQFREPLGTVDGRFENRRSILVRVEHDGILGWGEAPAFPSGRWGTIDAAWDALADPAVAAGGLPTPPIASAAVQAARADLRARFEGVPLHTRLGGAAKPITARHTLGLFENPDDLIDRMGEPVQRGISSFKVKVRPGWDVEYVRAARRTFPKIELSVDANGSYHDPEDEVFEAFAAAGVDLVEQPFRPDDLESHAALKARRTIAVCVDETIRSVADARHVVTDEAADVISLKANRLGLAATLQIIAIAIEAGVGVKIGGTFDTSIGRRHLLALATLEGVVDAEVAPPAGYLESDVATYPDLIAGTVTPDDLPGIGAVPDFALLEEVEVRRTVVQ